MRNRVLGVIFVALVLVIAGIGFSKFAGAESDVLFTNTSNSVIANLSVNDGKSLMMLGSLEPLESAHLRARLEGDGPAIVSWQWDGNAYEGLGCDKAALEGQIEIDGSSLIVIDCR